MGNNKKGKHRNINSNKRRKEQGIKGYSSNDVILKPKKGFKGSAPKAEQLAKNLLRQHCR